MLILILVVLFISFAGCRKEQTSVTPINPNPQEQAKVVKIDSDPQGATVFIDNDAPVETPIEYKLSFGTHYMTFRKAGYYDLVEKNVDINKDTTSIFVTLVEIPQDERHLTMGPILFDSVPHFACCSKGAIAYSNIFYGGTYTISGLTVLDSFDFVFPDGKKVHFDTEKAEGGERKFSKVVTFDELGGYEIISNGEHKYSFGVDYKAKILPGTPTLKDFFPDYNICDTKKAIAVPVGKEVIARLLITDAKGNPIRNKPLGVYDLKTDEKGIVTFKVRIERKECEYCYKIFVSGKPAQVRVYADILAWGYDFVYFTKDGHLIQSSSIPGIKSDVKVNVQDGDVYMPYGSFGFGISDMYQSDSPNNIVISSKDSSIIYTNSFVSRDSGAHWEKLGMSFDTIAVDPNKSNVLYGWSEINPYNISALFKSEDYGLHFAKIEDIEFVKQIVVDPNDSNTLYLATYKGLFKSNDGGKTWDHMVDPRSGNVEFVAVSPENSNVVLASTGMGLFKSEDQGKTWKKINLVKDNPQEVSPNCIVFDPANPETIYAGTDFAFFVSKDGGENWKKLGMFELFGNGSIAIDPTRPNKICIVSYGDGIYKSEDYGEHFTKIDFPFSFVTDIGITMNNLAELLVNDTGILFKMNKDGNFIPLGGDTFLKNGPKWKIIDGQFYIAVNTIKSDWVRVIVTDDAIEFYKASDMIP